MKNIYFYFCATMAVVAFSACKDCEVCTEQTLVVYENLDTISNAEFYEIFSNNDTTFAEINLCGDELDELKGNTITNSVEKTVVGIQLREVTTQAYTCTEN